MMRVLAFLLLIGVSAGSSHASAWTRYAWLVPATATEAEEDAEVANGLMIGIVGGLDAHPGEDILSSISVNDLGLGVVVGFSTAPSEDILSSMSANDLEIGNVVVLDATRPGEDILGIMSVNDLEIGDVVVLDAARPGEDILGIMSVNDLEIGDWVIPNVTQLGEDILTLLSRVSRDGYLAGVDFVFIPARWLAEQDMLMHAQ
ncbi:MAG: hypothetical protein AAGB12_10525 [Pseudomonadota bacterium]